MKRSSADSLPQETAEERHERVELLKKRALVIPRLVSGTSHAKEPVKILIDGAYGSHPDFTFQTFELMCKRAIDIVQNTWKIPWSEVTWICLASTWMKAIPITLIQCGLGKNIEFFIPCEGWKSTDEGFFFEGTEGRTLMKSMDLMQARLAETKKVKLCEIPKLTTQMKQCVQSGVGSMIKCGDFQQQRNNASETSTHVIHFPHITPAFQSCPPSFGSKEYNDAFYRQGGKSYEDKPPSRRAQVNVYDEIRSSGMGKPVTL